MRVTFYTKKKLKGMSHDMGDLGAEGRILLKWILKE
jgi:hypothetical protein